MFPHSLINFLFSKAKGILVFSVYLAKEVTMYSALHYHDNNLIKSLPSGKDFGKLVCSI